MSPRLLVWFVGALALVSSGCWRTHVYAITEADAAPASDSNPKPALDADAKPAIVCPTSVLKSGNSNLTLQVGSATRSYLLHVPPAYDGKKSVPLIEDFHGMPSTGAEELASSTYPSVTDAEGVVMVFPEGQSNILGHGWNFGPCCVAGADDLGFTKALVAHLQTVACIDPDRIYAVGTLTGSGMVYLLACQAADIFAAVAPSAFDLISETVDQCHPSRPITVISFRGTADSHVPYNGGASNLVAGMGITFLGAKKTFSTWGQLDDCTDTPSVEDSHGCSRYSSCKGGVEVGLCTKKDGKEEPGDATIAWPILKRYTR
jgi:polyhydroxybutyrate depolymerase